MINLENLSKTFPDGDLFTNVTLTIKHGMRAGLVGPNGSGKTTLLRIMLQHESPDSGNVQVEKSITIGYLAQDIVSGSNHWLPIQKYRIWKESYWRCLMK